MLVRRILIQAAIIAAALTVLYYILVASTAVAIYHYRTDNAWTKRVEHIFPYPAAYVNHQPISLSRFRKEVAARVNLTTKNNLGTSKTEIEKNVMTRLVNGQLYKQTLKKYDIVITDKDIDTSLESAYKQIGGKENLEHWLTEQYGQEMDLADFRFLTEEYLAQGAVEKQLLMKADVQHLMIAIPDNASDSDVAAAKKRLEDARAKITDLSKFSEVVKQYSEDTNSRDKDGALGTTTRGEISQTFSPEFENAVFTTPVNTLSEPVRSKHGWHVLLITKREGKVDKSLDGYLEQLHKEAKLELFFGS